MKDWNARLYREHAGFVSKLGGPVLELLDPRPGERILDLGCGDGVLSEKLAAGGCELVAVDASPDMVAPVLCGGDGVWRADYVRLRVLAVKAGAG